MTRKRRQSDLKDSRNVQRVRGSLRASARSQSEDESAGLADGELPKENDLIQVLWTVEESVPEQDPEWTGDDSPFRTPADMSGRKEALASPLGRCEGLKKGKGGLFWWFAKVVKISKQTRCGAIVYSNAMSGGGVDLISSTSPDETTEKGDECEVKWTKGGLLHSDYTGRPELQWRFARWDAANHPARQRLAPSTKDDEGGLGLKKRVQEIERAIHLLSNRTGPENSGMKAGKADDVWKDHARVLLQTLSRSEAYDALYTKEPRWASKNSVDPDLGTPDGRRLVLQTVLQTRGVNCTLQQFQRVADFVSELLGPASAVDAVPNSTFHGRHGKVRLMPDALRMRFPNTKLDKLAIEFEAYGDLCDALGFCDNPRPVIVGKAAGDVVCLLGTTVWIDGCSRSAEPTARPPDRCIFPCRSPFELGPSSEEAQHEDECDEGDDIAAWDGSGGGGGGGGGVACDSTKSTTARAWRVPVLTQQDSRIVEQDKPLVSTGFAYESKSSEVIGSLLSTYETVQACAHQRQQGMKFSISWSPSKGAVPPGVHFDGVPGLLHIIFPVCIVRTRQLSNSVCDVLDPDFGPAVSEECEQVTDEAMGAARRRAQSVALAQILRPMCIDNRAG